MRFAYAFLVGMLVLSFGTHAQAATKKYKVRIDSAPQGATVYIDNKTTAVGLTPYEGTLAKGSHTIYIDLDGYVEGTKVVKIARTRKLQDFFIPLTKKAMPPKISVT